MTSSNLMAQSSVDNLVVLLEPSVLEVDVAVETDGTVDGKGRRR
jgi:hypothetical protein